MTVLVLLLSSPSLMTGQAAPEADAAVSARVCAVEGTAGVSSTSERVLAAMTTLLPSRSPAPDAGAALIAALGSIGGRSKGALSPAALVDAEGGAAAAAAAAAAVRGAGDDITTGGATGTAVAAAAGSAAEGTGISVAGCAGVAGRRYASGVPVAGRQAALAASPLESRSQNVLSGKSDYRSEQCCCTVTKAVALAKCRETRNSAGWLDCCALSNCELAGAQR